MTLSHLVDNAKDIIIKFPNADNIEANIIKKTIPKFLSILKLKTPPKIERGLMFFSDSIQIKKGDYLFALFYPIANTQEDKHILREGSILSKSGPNGEDEFFEIDFPIHPLMPTTPMPRSYPSFVISSGSLFFTF